MNLENPTLTPDAGAAPLVPETTGQLNLRPEILEGFLSVRQQVEQLQSLLHQVMRRVALPRCREIGNELIRVRNFYPKGKTGPGGVSSGFYRDAEAVTGLKKRSLQGYIAIAENWARLMDYMADLPEGATPITSLRSALEAIREMNRPLRPAASEDAIDVDAEAAEDTADAPEPVMKRTSFAASTRDKVMPALSGLFATKVLTELQRERLGKVQEMLQLLLDDIDATEAAAAVPEVISTPAEREPAMWSPSSEETDYERRERETQEQRKAFMASRTPVPAVSTLPPKGLQPLASTPEPADDEPSAKVKPSDLYPATEAGLEKLEADLMEHGSGAALARHLGVTRAAISSRLKTLRESLG